MGFIAVASFTIRRCLREATLTQDYAGGRVPTVPCLKTPSYLLSLSLASFALALNPLLHTADADYKPELFQSTKLIYEDRFDGALNTEFWEVRQNTTWSIKDGVLTGSPSSQAFQRQEHRHERPGAD